MSLTPSRFRALSQVPYSRPSLDADGSAIELVSDPHSKEAYATGSASLAVPLSQQTRPTIKIDTAPSRPVRRPTVRMAPSEKPKLLPARNPPRGARLRDVWPFRLLRSKEKRAAEKQETKREMREKARRGFVSSNVPLEITLYLSRSAVPPTPSSLHRSLPPHVTATSAPSPSVTQSMSRPRVSRWCGKGLSNADSRPP